MFKLQLSAKAKKQLKQIFRTYDRQALYGALEEIKEDPYLGKKLGLDLTGKFSYRVSVYRIIYKVSFTEKKITILRVGHRSTIYK